MQELLMKNKKINIKVFINGTPNVTYAGKEELDTIVAMLEISITERHKSKHKVVTTGNVLE